MVRNRKVIIAAFLMIFFVSHAFCGEEGQNDQKQKWLSAIRVGLLAHDVSIWSLSSKEGGVDYNAEFIINWPNYSLFAGTVSSNLGVSVNNQGDTSKLYSGFLWEYRWKSVLFFNSGIGIVVHNGELETDDDDKKELGSRVLFRIPIEIGLLFAEHHGLSIMFDHVSNAYLAEPNHGLDTLGIRYTYRF